MITARIHVHSDTEDGVLVQFFALPRVGETISISMPGEPERDLRVVSVNHWVQRVPGHKQQHLQQVEAVVFTQPAVGF